MSRFGVPPARPLPLYRLRGNLGVPPPVGAIIPIGAIIYQTQFQRGVVVDDCDPAWMKVLVVLMGSKVILNDHVYFNENSLNESHNQMHAYSLFLYVHFQCIVYDL